MTAWVFFQLLPRDDLFMRRHGLRLPLRPATDQEKNHKRDNDHADCPGAPQHRFRKLGYLKNQPEMVLLRDFTWHCRLPRALWQGLARFFLG